MKKIIKLTERDLARIVKRVISEQISPNVASTTSVSKLPSNYDGPKKPNLSTKLNPGVDPIVVSCDDLERFNTATFESDEITKAKSKGLVKTLSYSIKGDWQGEDPNDDPYNYIILNNSKYCYHHSNDDTNKKWKEVTDPKAKAKIDMIIKNRKS
jgi:hypothetical protein